MALPSPAVWPNVGVLTEETVGLFCEVNEWLGRGVLGDELDWFWYTLEDWLLSAGVRGLSLIHI